MPTTPRGLARLELPGRGICLAAVTDDALLPLGAPLVADGWSPTLAELVAEDLAPREFARRVEQLAGSTSGISFARHRLDGQGPRWLAPVDRQECWGAGCTYRVDQEGLERMRVDRPPYAAVYEADRPLLFFKSTAERVVGHGGHISPRPAAERTIPEAELAVLFGPSGQVLAFSLANDVTALDLEQANPLYQPQAKIFEGSTVLGPWWTPAAWVPDVMQTPFGCRVERHGRVVVRQTIDPSRLVRTLDELSAVLFEGLAHPWGAVLMTGGGAAVPEGFGLEIGDHVMIKHPLLGDLRNDVSSCVRSADASGATHQERRCA